MYKWADCMLAHMWRSEGNIQEWVLSYLVGPGDQTQVHIQSILKIDFMCISVFLGCMHVPCVLAWHLQRPGKDVWYLGTEVTGSREPPCGC